MTGPTFLDTNIVVRYVVGTPPNQAARATEIINGGERLTITGVCLLEIYFVLSREYQISREQIIDHLTDLVLRDNITPYVLDEDLLIQGLQMCRGSTRVSIGDALIWAEARTAGAQVIYSFDQRFPSDGLEIRG